MSSKIDQNLLFSKLKLGLPEAHFSKEMNVAELICSQVWVTYIHNWSLQPFSQDY